MTRRSPWGSVRRLPSGRFQARYRVGSVEYLAPQTFSTARQAHAFLATTRTAIEHGAWIDINAATVPLADYATRWLRERALLRPRTSELYEGLLRLHILPTLGTMPLEAVRPRHIRDLVLDLRKQAVLAPRTIRQVYAIAACMFRTAVADELIPFTPCVLAKRILPKNVDKDASFRANAIFTREEVESRDRLLPVLLPLSETGGIAGVRVRPQRDSNPRSCLERALSWAGLDDGVPTRDG